MARLKDIITDAAKGLAGNSPYSEGEESGWPEDITRLSIRGALAGDVIQAGILGDYQGTYEAVISYTWQYHMDLRWKKTMEETQALKRPIERTLKQICLGQKLPKEARHQRVRGTPQGFWKFRLEDGTTVIYYRPEPKHITMIRAGEASQILGGSPNSSANEEGNP